MPPWMYYTFSTAVYILVVLIAILKPKLDFVLGIIGSTAVTLISFYGPAGFYLGAIKIEDQKVSKLSYIFAWMWLILGFFFFFFCNFFVIYEAFK